MLRARNSLDRVAQRVTRAPKKVKKVLHPAADQENVCTEGMDISPSQCMEAPVRCCGVAHRQENNHTLKGKGGEEEKTEKKGLKDCGNINCRNPKVAGCEPASVLPAVYVSKIKRDKNHQRIRIPVIHADPVNTPGKKVKKVTNNHHNHHHHVHHYHSHGLHGHHHGHHGENGTIGMLKKHHHKFHVANPEPSAIIDDDLLFMDVDFDPLMKIRDIQTRVPLGVQNIDQMHTFDPMCVPEYAQEIYHYLRGVENSHILSEDYLQNNPKVTSDMRAILTDWLIQVQVHQQMSQQTLHLCVALIDQVLNKVKISLSLLQLLGITSMLIAAKYAERFPPEITSLCQLTDNSYEPHQVLGMEKFVLKELKFNLNICEPVLFLDRFLEVEKDENTQVEYLAQYLLDLSLTSTNFVTFAPSKIAASALMMARKILGFKSWTPGLGYYTMYAEKDLNKCGNNLCKELLKATSSKYQGAKNKYSSRSCFKAISNHPSVVDEDFIKEVCDMETIIM